MLVDYEMNDGVDTCYNSVTHSTSEMVFNISENIHFTAMIGVDTCTTVIIIASSVKN